MNKLAQLIKNNPLSYEVMVYDVNKGRRKVMKSKTSKKKYTLNQIGDALFELIKTTNKRFDQIDARLDNLERDVSQLKQDVKGINTRLDYIVAANKLKDLPNNK